MRRSTVPPGGRSTRQTSTTSTSISSFLARPFLTTMTTIGLLGHSPAQYDSSFLYSIAPVEKRPRLSTSTISSKTQRLYRPSASSTTPIVFTTSIRPSTTYQGPMTLVQHQAAADILNNIGIALYHRLNWTTLSRTLSNSFYNLFDSIYPACDFANATRLQIRHYHFLFNRSCRNYAASLRFDHLYPPTVSF